MSREGVTLLLGVLGLVLGSFIQALVWRLHENKDWVKGRSECEHCHHRLGLMDLIPVVSWLMLRGKCRYCHAKLSKEMPIIEIVMGLLVAGSYWYWPQSFHGQGLFDFVVWIVMLTGLVAMAIYDIKWLILPDKIMYPLLYLALSAIAVHLLVFDGGVDRVRIAVLGVLVGGGLFYVIYQISQGKWIGGGDVKLGILLGLQLGPWQAMIAVYAGALLGALSIIPLVFAKRLKLHRRQVIPFGPYLIMGIIIAKLFGLAMINWYKRKYQLN